MRTPSPKKITILIVEDSPTQTEQLRHLLDQHSYLVTAAKNGREALDLIGQHKPDLVISDINMPEMNGFNLCKNLKENENTQKIPIILLTELSDTNSILEGLACGANGFISKPYNPDFLLAEIKRKYLDRFSLHDKYKSIEMEIPVSKENLTINTPSQRIVNLILSNYEESINRNSELFQALEDLNSLHEHLEELVLERTADLSAEIIERTRTEEEIRLLQHITDLVVASSDFDAALEGTLEKVCKTTGWVFGEAWLPTLNGNGLECSPVWYDGTGGGTEFRQASEKYKAEKGTGFLWQVWNSKKPVWIKDLPLETDFPRAAEASRSGFKAGVGIPLLAKDEVIAVMVFFMPEAREEDGRLIRLVSTVSAQLGMAFHYKQIEKAEKEITDKELTFQTGEKADRAAKFLFANRNLRRQNEEEAKRAAELIIANKELVFQTEEKEKSAAKLIIANNKLVIQKEKIEDLNEQLENRVRRRTAQLESANKELELLSYSISHDLKAPLRQINAFGALLAKKYLNLLPDEGRRYVENIFSATKNMGELIDGLLRFSKSGRVEMKQSVLNMNAIVDAYIQPIRDEDVEHRIVFNIDSMPLAFGDLEMIKSVWGNLIDNAVKFTRKNELAKITIAAEQTENETIYHIMDNGAGFDMSLASKLFTVFQRLHSREDYEGTGIGLATVQKVITRHGGRIWAEAKVGEGAAFYFTLTKRKKSE